MKDPDAPIRPSKLAPILRPINAYMQAETAGGITLLVAAVVALVWANSPWQEGYRYFWHQQMTIGPLAMSLEHWVNDGLMVVFFVLVGLEIKRELLVGELASLQRAALPIAAAVGGMVVPAGIYYALNHGGSFDKGWGVPMATDIAFAVGALAVVGRRVPFSVKVFLLAIAIVDDLGAVLVIAFFYTSDLSMMALMTAAGFLLVLILLNMAQVHQPWPYLTLGVGLWLATLYSGLHATVAGVMLAFTIPATRSLEEKPYVEYMRSLLKRFDAEADDDPDRITEKQGIVLTAMTEVSQAVQTPLARVEHALLRPVNFVIIPIFALANSGVTLVGADYGALLRDHVLWGVMLGLLLGKPVGVLIASWLAIRMGVAKLPAGATMSQIVGVAVLCGIGFTMALFVANLAFPNQPAAHSAAKLGIMGASICSGIIGGIILAKFSGKPAPSPEPVAA